MQAVALTLLEKFWPILVLIFRAGSRFIKFSSFILTFKSFIPQQALTNQQSKKSLQRST
jgi:hypothetical protein